MQVADVSLNRPFKAKYTSEFNRCQIQGFLESPPDDTGASLSQSVAAYAAPCMSAMLSAWQHCYSTVDLKKTLEKIGYTKAWRDPDFSIHARRRAEALGQHEEELVAELAGALPSSARANASLVSVEGSEDEARWDIEEDEELATLTRLLAEGIPHDQQDFFSRE
jgi:hypothetical protein